MNPHTGFPRAWWRLAQHERSACIRQLVQVGEPGPIFRGATFRRKRWEDVGRPLTGWRDSYALKNPVTWVSRHLAPVYRPPESFYEPISAWYRYQHRHADAKLHILGDRCCPRHHFMVRWQWPPLPDHPTHGWRAQLVARCFVATCMAHRWRMDWQTWDELQHVAKGTSTFSARLLDRVNAGVVRGKLWWEKKDRPFTITLGAGGVKLGRRG